MLILIIKLKIWKVHKLLLYFINIQHTIHSDTVVHKQGNEVRMVGNETKHGTPDLWTFGCKGSMR